MGIAMESIQTACLESRQGVSSKAIEKINGLEYLENTSEAN